MKFKVLAKGFVCFLLLAGSASAGLGQVNKGSLAGLVRDATGSVVPAAEVTLMEVQTGTTHKATTDSTGYYVFPFLESGNYTLTVTHPGFKTFTKSGLMLHQLQAEVDVTLDVGAVTQSVTVTGGAPVLETRQATVSNVEDTHTLSQLPLQLSGSKRDPTNYESTIPGYQGGAGFQSNFNGSIGTYNELTVNGAPAECNPAVLGGCLREGFSSEAVSEFKVVTDSTAEQGFNAGVLISMTTKSGTNNLHGSAFEYLRNDALDARNFFSSTVPKDKQNEFGFTVGGPVRIPKVYNGKDKTFFFFNLEWFRYYYALAGSTYTMPIPAYRNGDFSSLLGPQIGTDALGRPVLSGAIYDPSTQRVVNGAIVRDPFPGNVIPQAQWSPVSSKFQSFYPTNLTNNNPTNNYIVAGGAGSTRNRTLSIQIDQYVGAKQHISGIMWTSMSTNHGPWALPDIFAVRNYSWSKSWNPRLNWTWTMSSNTVNNAGIALVRGPNFTSSDKDAANKGAELIGQPHPTGPCIPAVHIGAIFGGTQNELKCGQGESDTNWSMFDNLSHMRGKHYLKFGWNYTHWAGNFPVTNNGQFTFLPAQTGLPGFISQTGFAYASFLLGAVDDAAIQGGNYEDGRSYTFGFYAQDEYHVTPKLTLNLGLRWDGQPFPIMSKNEVSQFVPTLPNPGAGNRPGALTFAGFGPGRCNCRRVAPSHWWDRNFGPRIGFAYQLNEKTVARGSWGWYWGPVTQQMAGFDAVEQQGFFPLFTQASTDSFTPPFNWTGGFPLPPTGLAPSLTPDVANGSTTFFFGKDAGRPPSIQMVHFSIQRELPGRIGLTASYIGQFSRGIINTNVENINQLHFDQLGSLAPLLGEDVYSPAAQAAGVKVPYPGFTGTVAQAIRPFPQYLNVMNEGSAISWANYNSFQVKMQKEFSNGLSFLLGYTIAKQMSDTGSSGGPVQNGSVPGFFAASAADTWNHRVEKGLAGADIPQQLLLNYVYELPFGPGKRFANGHNVVTRYLVGGWSVAGVHTYQSGTPIWVTTEKTLPTTGISWGSITLRPDRVPGVPIRTSASCSSSGLNPFTQTLLNVAAFTDPQPLKFGNVSRTLPNVRACGSLNENISLFKDIPLYKERARFQIGVDTFNLFNRVVWGYPATDIDSPGNFGKVGSAGSGRIIQLHARIDW